MTKIYKFLLGEEKKKGRRAEERKCIHFESR
jgi:hypothetical protein